VTPRIGAVRTARSKKWYVRERLMKIVDLIRRDMVVPALQATEKRAILEELAVYMAGRHPRIDRATLSRVLIEREQLASTAIGADDITIRACSRAASRRPAPA